MKKLTPTIYPGLPSKVYEVGNTGGAALGRAAGRASLIAGIAVSKLFQLDSEVVIVAVVLLLG